jgi:hypothetical protein
MKAKEQLSDIVPDVLGACFHGIGHGLVDDDGEAQWVSESKMVDLPLKFCSKAATEEHLLYRCSSGVFNSLAIAYTDNRVTATRSDPLGFCKQLEIPTFRMACYDEMNTYLIKLASDDYVIAVKHIETIPIDGEAKSAARSLAQSYSNKRSEKKELLEAVDSCRSTQERLRLSCIFGFSAGLVEKGAPRNEQIKSIEFCTLESLKDDEIQACFDGLLWYMGRLYSRDMSEDLCKKIEPRFRNYCNPRDNIMKGY